jgi:hypothetical protein
MNTGTKSVTRLSCCCLLLVASGFSTTNRVFAVDQAGQLRLIPFPKKVQLVEGTFDLNRTLVLETGLGPDAYEIQCLAEELQRAGLAAPRIDHLEGGDHLIVLRSKSDKIPGDAQFRENASSEDYLLDVRRDVIRCAGMGPAGRLYAVQTLCQLIRANRTETSIPCLSIRDWPSLRWRCFQDDLTRGPSSKPVTLEHGLNVGSYLKLNLFTYYMEYQYAFSKHPEIGPVDGSLTPDELRQLVVEGRERQIDVLGNQQSFGHFGRILQHDRFANLRENASVLSPVREETYELLDDLYSEVCPLLPFPMFNVCCDETWGLGEGPSKQLAEQIGTGGVYVQHIRRVHDLLKDKYGKRMIMWGDIILQHPDKLDQIPRDTVMLTWGYGAKESFEDQILPFKASGYEFFVCPGISNWSRILPDFGVATTNIQNFVRDGARHGAIGMLNTDWEDDGESLQGYRWHGHAWGAECAWNASTTTPEQFNRRVGAVLFGEPGDDFGKAIELLGKAHRLSGMDGMLNRRFWKNDFVPQKKPSTILRSSRRLLELVEPAIEHLERCREQATVNAELLDSFLLGARRMQWIGTRMRDGLEAAQLYESAHANSADRRLDQLAKVVPLVRANRDCLVRLGSEFKRIWELESKPYALDWTMTRYRQLTQWYDQLLQRLESAQRAAASGEEIPSPSEMGLALPQQLARSRHASRRSQDRLRPEDPWLEPDATHRISLVIEAGDVKRLELPIEIEVELPDHLEQCPLRAFLQIDEQSSPPREILAQLDNQPGSCHQLLTLLVTGPIPAGGSAAVTVYLGLKGPASPLPAAVRVEADGEGGFWIENDRVRGLLQPEGAHLYCWQVKALADRDLTNPGDEDWSGFADCGHAMRREAFVLECLRAGPAVAEFRCANPTGFEKIIRCFGGANWFEVDLNEALTYYWDFDDPDNFAADGSHPGQYLFSEGKSGAVGRHADGVQGQVRAAGQRWAMKSNDEGVILGMATPEVPANFVIGPGAGAGGVGIENSPPASHFVTVAGCCGESPGEFLADLTQSLNYRNQPIVILYGIQARPSAASPN